MSIAIRLPDELEHELAETAKKARRSKSFIVREAIKYYLEDLNDYYVGMEALRNTKHIYSAEEIRKELGLDD
ncbi:MAG: ribbon-helix-helix protein, CopG family [Legionella sp.]|uniref:type II toxin-antitoxin system RelB family antitoxin n=1 Tax=Legionella sp. TaxID=459 RepID=UPI0039E2FE9E